MNQHKTKLALPITTTTITTPLTLLTESVATYNYYTNVLTP